MVWLQVDDLVITELIFSSFAKSETLMREIFSDERSPNLSVKTGWLAGCWLVTPGPPRHYNLSSRQNSGQICPRALSLAKDII